MMRVKLFLAAALLVLGAVWLYAVSRSAGQVLGFLDALPEQPSAAATPTDASTERPSAAAPPAAHPVTQEESAFVPAMLPADASVERPADEERNRVHASPLPAPSRVYAGDDAGSRAVDDGLVHPEVTDPRMRRILRPAWDD